MATAAETNRNHSLQETPWSAFSHYAERTPAFCFCITQKWLPVSCPERFSHRDYSLHEGSVYCACEQLVFSAYCRRKPLRDGFFIFIFLLFTGSASGALCHVEDFVAELIDASQKTTPGMLQMTISIQKTLRSGLCTECMHGVLLACEGVVVCAAYNIMRGVF